MSEWDVEVALAVATRADRLADTVSRMGVDVGVSSLHATLSDGSGRELASVTLDRGQWQVRQL